MPIESRSRMISFRLTSEEYERFRELCFTNGIRSVSEMARAAINLLLQQPARAPQEALEGRVSELEGRLHMLALEMKQMTSARSSNALGHPTLAHAAPDPKFSADAASL